MGASGTGPRATLREADVQRAILLECCDACDLMRNNVGVAHEPDGRVVRYGVGGPGGADLIGVVRATGRFIAVECKSPTGRTSPEQDLFLSRVRRSGGIAVVARCPQDVLEALK